MNHLHNHIKLKNRYFVMRHGESKANVAKIIISTPENGVKEDYALSELGHEQARQSAEKTHLGPDTVIFTSDFSRARETAEIVAEVIGATTPIIAPALRERHFGEFEEKSNVHYDDVWAHDAHPEHGGDHTEYGVESVNANIARTTAFILELEETYDNRDILLVSHGDTLQILQTAFDRVEPHTHRSLKHLETGEIRPVMLAAQ